ncbi:F0F1 ATP synthase subunit delta [Paenibacillus radicis (ex Gao et al. 2016)]|uniref:ATP synthase subunit delta n=1 Tax=Paenibacillus radicis (ex Gao et al. 2016) TaxID=1737354 RepID=A0A917HPF4_9BACL|nr:F0F1 ATP synthase subunit delta [Paenibacillus radicis (ex Gao et al. 2016)]GGG85022.1 ATP synthase subunit delta [Paenibacillus radicis (ex Gao et al. 2016)]
MSRDTVVAKRYAKALFELAQQNGIAAEVEDQLKLIVDTLAQNEEVVKFLSFPSIDPANKISVLKSTFGDNVSNLVLNTLELLVVRGRQDVIAEVYEAFTKIAGEVLGQAHATIYAATQLSVTEFADVVTHFSQVTGKKIIAQQIVEPALLGGVQVRIGDRLYDGSLSGKLDRLQKSFK